MRLDPTVGSEMRKTRPVVVLSPDVMNGRLHTVIVAPLTMGGFAAPFRVPCRFGGSDGQIALDHLRSLSKTRCVQRLGELEPASCAAVLSALAQMFAH